MPENDALLGITDDPVRFEEAIRAIRRRVPMTEETFSALEQEELAFAFTVADVAELDVVVDVYEAITRAVADGETFADFKARVGDELEEAWGEENPARLESIFETNTMSAYNSGRHEAAHAVKNERPFWRFDGPNDGRTSDICRPCVGIILPADHPWWRRHYPILHPRCFEPLALVTTSTGPVPIQDVKSGDLVLTHRGRFRKVTGLLRSPAPKALFHVGLVNGGHASGGTAEHPALTDRGWVELAALRPGDRILHTRELAPDDVEVRDGHHRDPMFEEGLQAGRRHTVRVLGEFDSEVGARKKEVDEEELVAKYERLLEDDISAGVPQPIEKDALDPRGSDAIEPMRRWVGAMKGALGGHGLLHRLWSLRPTSVPELLRHAGNAWVSLFGVAKVPVWDSFCLALCMRGGERQAGGVAPSLVIPPLASDGFGAMSKRDAVLPEKSLGRPGAVCVADDLGDLADRQARRDIQAEQVFAKVDAVNFEQLALDWTHADSFMATWKEIRKVDVRPFSGQMVYNFSVEEDESYVVDGMVVHNCRHRVSTLTKEQAEKEGVTEHPPDVEVPDGFGKPPALSGGSDWEPDPSDYPKDFRSALEDRLDADDAG